MFVLTTRLATLMLLAVAALAKTSPPSPAPKPAGLQFIAAGTALLLIGIPRRGPKK